MKRHKIYYIVNIIIGIVLFLNLNAMAVESQIARTIGEIIFCQDKDNSSNMMVPSVRQVDTGVWALQVEMQSGISVDSLTISNISIDTAGLATSENIKDLADTLVNGYTFYDSMTFIYSTVAGDSLVTSIITEPVMKLKSEKVTATIGYWNTTDNRNGKRKYINY